MSICFIKQMGFNIYTIKGTRFAYIHAFFNAYIHTYILHTYILIYTYMHTYILHTHIQYILYNCLYTRMLKSSIKNFKGFRNVRKSIETSADISVL